MMNGHFLTEEGTKPQMVGSDLILVVSRLKREDCKRIKHDSRFSKWKILVGPFDWEDYSVGKEGAERYRVLCLPKREGPGVYELGIADLRTGLGREIGKLDLDQIVPVYLGQADIVKTRLQQYGRSGAHLGSGCSTGHPSDCLQKGAGLFEEILSKGYHVVYRWAPMENKSHALKTETELLSKFDYAWNTSINGARRPDDVFQKLKKISSSTTQFSNIPQKLLPFSQKKVGIRIKSSKVLPTEDKFSTYDDGESHHLVFRVFKSGRSQPRLVLDRSDITQENTIICGVDVGDGSICRRPPVLGRRRCSEHKGMKINGSIKVGVSNSNVDSQCSNFRNREFDSHDAPNANHDPVELPLVKVPVSFTSICGFILFDGSPCRSHPIQGLKRCAEHKGRRIVNPPISFTPMCGFILSDGSPCRSHPIQGLKRCAEHKGRRIVNPPISFTPIFTPICGFILFDGSPCRSHPIQGRKRCAKHKGKRIH